MAYQIYDWVARIAGSRAFLPASGRAGVSQSSGPSSIQKLQAQLYRPTIGCVGIANPQEILHRNPMPGRMTTGEMSPFEGALAAQWLGLETVLPCHYINPDDPDVHAFEKHIKDFAAKGERVPHSMVLKPGDSIEVAPGGKSIGFSCNAETADG